MKNLTSHSFRMKFSYLLECFGRCRGTGDVPSSSNTDDKVDPDSGVEMSCPSNVKSGYVPVCSTTGHISHMDQSFCGYVQQPA